MSLNLTHNCQTVNYMFCFACCDRTGLNNLFVLLCFLFFRRILRLLGAAVGQRKGFFLFGFLCLTHAHTSLNIIQR